MWNERANECGWCVLPHGSSPSIPHTISLFHIELLSQTSLEEKWDILFRNSVIWEERIRLLLKPGMVYTLRIDHLAE